MATDEECKVFEQKIEEIEHRNDNRYKDFHNHLRELRADFSDNVAEQMQRHNELTKAQEDNTQAIHDLTKSTQSLVDAITAGKVIGNFARWVIPIAVAISAFVAWFNHTPPSS